MCCCVYLYEGKFSWQNLTNALCVSGHHDIRPAAKEVANLPVHSRCSFLRVSNSQAPTLSWLSLNYWLQIIISLFKMWRVRNCLSSIYNHFFFGYLEQCLVRSSLPDGPHELALASKLFQRLNPGANCGHREHGNESAIVCSHQDDSCQQRKRQAYSEPRLPWVSLAPCSWVKTLKHWITLL